MNSFSGSNFISVDTPFSLVDACLFAQLVDLMDTMEANVESASQNSKAKLSYERIWSDMRKCVDRCSLHSPQNIFLLPACGLPQLIIFLACVSMK